MCISSLLLYHQFRSMSETSINEMASIEIFQVSYLKLFDIESSKKCEPRIIILKLLGKISFIKLELIQYTSVNIHQCQEKKSPSRKMAK